MRALIINKDVRTQIKFAVERARAKPIPWSQLQAYTLPGNTREIKLGDRPKGFERVESQFVVIPDGYRASFSFEEQPAGILRHLSVSVSTPGKLPSLEAFQIIAEEFGFTKDGDGTTWMEEFAPGHHAVNILQVAVEHKGSTTKQ